MYSATSAPVTPPSVKRLLHSSPPSAHLLQTQIPRICNASLWMSSYLVFGFSTDLVLWNFPLRKFVETLGLWRYRGKNSVSSIGWFEVIWPIKSTEDVESVEDFSQPMGVEIWFQQPFFWGFISGRWENHVDCDYGTMSAWCEAVLGTISMSIGDHFFCTFTKIFPD